MKRIMILFLLWLILPIPSKGNAGTFNRVTGLYWCTDDYSCLHEQAHLIDKQNGWVSQSKEYADILSIYMFYLAENEGFDESFGFIRLVVGKSIIEAYADIYAVYGGNVPNCLKEFYPELRTRQYNFGLPLDKGKVFIPVPLEWVTP